MKFEFVNSDKVCKFENLPFGFVFELNTQDGIFIKANPEKATCLVTHQQKYLAPDTNCIIKNIRIGVAGVGSKVDINFDSDLNKVVTFE